METLKSPFGKHYDNYFKQESLIHAKIRGTYMKKYYLQNFKISSTRYLLIAMGNTVTLSGKKSVKHLLKQLIKVNITSNGTNQHHVLPDTMH